MVFGRVLDVFGGGSLCHGLVMCWNVTPDNLSSIFTSKGAAPSRPEDNI